MRDQRLVLTSTLALAGAIAGAAPAAAGISCPAEIAVTQTLAATPDGWTAGNDTLPTGIAGLAVFDGPPEERAQLIPDDERKTADGLVVIWNLQPSDRGYWITCQYASTTATLTRQLPASVTKCEMTQELGVSYVDGRPFVLGTDCGPAD